GAIDTAVATKLDAQATGGNIYIDETASLALGRIEAGTAADRKDITLTAGGAITDNNSEVKADDSEEENLVGGAISLTAGGSIGAAGDGDIDTQVDSLDASADGDIFIDETDALDLGRIVAVTNPGGSNEQRHAITIEAGSAGVAGGLTDKTPDDDSEENLVGGAVRLTAVGGAIGAADATDIDTKVDSLDASAGGDIFIDETDDLALGQIVAGTDADRKNITLTAGGAITDGNSETKADDSEEENLVGGNISLTAGG
ncbi:hypothetical protein, partial [Candidatus Thiosymbion oneisti]|uniref:hypothetical protein n=1 Tax=Candidatus Thiosymbion oneisti TaxID=589554 RepID=UPI0015B76061